MDDILKIIGRLYLDLYQAQQIIDAQNETIKNLTGQNTNSEPKQS